MDRFGGDVTGKIKGAELTPDCFCQTLLSCDQGRIILCNLLSGLQHGIIKEDFVRELLDWWRALSVWTIEKYYRDGLGSHLLSPALIDYFRTVLYEIKPPGFRAGVPKPDFFFEGLHLQHRLSSSNEMVTVVELQAFVNHLLHADEHRKLFGLMGARVTIREINRLIMKQGSQFMQCRDDAQLGRPDRVLWFAPVQSEGQPLVFWGGTSAPSADQIRDRLGLHHYQEDVSLVAIHFPATLLHTRVHARPTVADSGGHVRFKSAPDRAVHKKRRTWGYTVDLEKLAGGRDCLDGWPERIAEPLPIPSGQKLRVTPLGVLTCTRGKTGLDNDAIFAGRVCSKYGTINQLHARFMSFL